MNQINRQVLSHKKTWRKPKCILLTERTQSEKATCCMIPQNDIVVERAKLWRQGLGKEKGINWWDTEDFLRQ